jgi:hypothetical protein
MNHTCGTKTNGAHFVRRLYLGGVIRHTLLIGMAFLLLGVGCGKGGPSRNAVSGAVQLDGKPLEKSLIRFSPIKGAKGPVTGGTIENGRYQLPQAIGPMEGRHRVEINANRKTGRRVPMPFARQGETEDEYGEAIPSRFNSESTLEVEVKPGDNTLDFNLTTR